MITACPYKYYQEIRKGGAVDNLPLLCKPLVAGVANNQEFIPAVTDKIIRVMGYDLFSNSLVTFEDGSGGSTLYTMDGANGLPVQKEIKDCGYFETTAGVGLYGDVATNTARMNIFYVVYTP